MSYQQASSFYQNNLGGAINGYGENLGSNLQGSYSSYESASASGYGSGNDEAFLGTNNGYYSSSSYDALDQQGFSGTSFANGGGGGYNANNLEQQQSSALSTNYATNAGGLYQDPNPQVVRRPALGGAQTYTQRVTVKFLRPPPLPPPGPLIIKEVRPPQPPPPPPLYIRQRPPPPKVLPPLVIREAPPKMPAAVGTQVITKMLPPLPVPPRSVIIERLPPLPPKPRDVIVERWLPYRTQQKRRVIIQRAPPAVVPKPRNIIIYYEAPKAQVVRRFQNLGVQVANPADYVARYGTQLEDAHTLVTHARQAGVVEDISPPGAGSQFQSSAYGNYQSNNVGISSNNYGSSSAYNTYGGATGLESSFDDFNLINNTNGINNNYYDSYSSQQIYS